MDDNKFKYLLTIIDEGNMTKAAKKLYISQPALTNFVNKLEEELGVRLFNRASKPICLTYAGERYIKEMKRILHLQSRLHNELDEISGGRRGRLVIGIGSARGSFWLPHILPLFLKEHPNIEVKIVEGTNQEFEEALYGYNLDLCITATPFFAVDFDYEVLTEETIVLVAAPGHPILKGKNIEGNSIRNLLLIEPKILNGEKFICPAKGFGLYRCTKQILEKFSIQPGEIMEINNSDTAFYLAAEGLGLTFTPDISVTPPLPARKPIYCTLENPPYKRTIVAAYNKSVGLTPAGQDFIRLTREVITTCPELQILE